MPFGATHQPFGGGTVTFTGIQDFSAPNATHSVFITYDIANDASDGHTVDAKINTDHIRIEGTTRTPSPTAIPPVRAL